MSTPSTFLRDLGSGLIIRRATQQDAAALAEFNANMHGDRVTQKPDLRIGAWVRDLIERDHPTLDAGDFTIVEDTATGAIVSSLNLIPQTWTYGGIPFGVGRVELVGTLAGYRERGLVRAQMALVHQWSAERGHQVQSITGIPYYYRQFGYEMGLALAGGRLGYEPQVPKLKEGEPEPYHFRPATEADLPFIAQRYAAGNQRYLVACLRDAALWQYELNGRSEANVNYRHLRLIETADGQPVGFLAHPNGLWLSTVAATAYELIPGRSWAAVTPSVIRYLQSLGPAYAEHNHEPQHGFGFALGAEHPVYEALGGRLPHLRRPYAWYVRIPNLLGFLQHVTPVLQQRLAGSVLAGHTGELTLSFYRSGLRLAFDRGALTVAAWQPTPDDRGAASFPDLTFLQLLFGYRSLDELKYAFADCHTEKDGAHELLTALFPKQFSNVWPVD